MLKMIGLLNTTILNITGDIITNSLSGGSFMINAVEYDELATNVFYPIYPVIAMQIKEKTGNMEKGYCMDIGSGNGYLGIALAKITDMQVTLYDISQEILKIADKRIEENNIKHKVNTEVGNVESINKPDESVDLIISRGSVFFWEDRVKAFREIYRVLKVGGYAYIGGGFGTKELKDEIDRIMVEKNPNWGNNLKTGSAKTFSEEIEQAGIKTYEITENDFGIWMVIEKTT